jgi:hypothetical protein
LARNTRDDCAGPSDELGLERRRAHRSERDELAADRPALRRRVEAGQCRQFGDREVFALTQTIRLFDISIIILFLALLIVWVIFYWPAD